MSKLSVIIPLYNSEKYIEETLMSLVGQKDNDFEVVIVDDKSTDNSVQVVKEFLEAHKELNATLYTERPAVYPKGVSGTRNFGVEKARGEWVSFLDSDDLFHPDKIKYTNQFINSIGESSSALHHSMQNFIDGEKIDFNKDLVTGKYTTEDILSKLCKENIVATSTVVVRKSAFVSEKGFDPDLNGIEDYYLWLLLSKKTSWSYINAGLTGYRVRTDSLMGRRRMVYYIEQNHRLVSKVLQNDKFSIEEKREVDAYLMERVMYYYAQVSYDQFGWLDLLNGLNKLFFLGYYRISVKLLVRQLKHSMLSVLSRNKKGK